MKIFSDKLTQQDLDSIAEHMGIELYQYEQLPPRTRGRFAKPFAHSFVLRPRFGFDRWRKSGYYKRRTWAVSWAGHYVFMRAVFVMDEEAIITSGNIMKRGQLDPNNRKSWGIEYHGVGDFIDKAADTGATSRGSMMYPVEYQDMEVEGHFQWDGDLDALDIEAGRVVMHGAPS